MEDNTHNFFRAWDLPNEGMGAATTALPHSDAPASQLRLRDFGQPSLAHSGSFL